MGETRPTPPSLDESRGPVGDGTGKQPAPEVAPGKQQAAADRELSAQCLRDERAAAAGGSRRAEPATSTPPQNPR
ncbi:MAG TPA: hypothetical protein VEU32_12515 [Burkholderiales bacterium]|nr:hypothetical protein [Burkholderiales bacterium]